MALSGTERWEIELAIEAALDCRRELGCPVARAAEVVCEMHGIVDELERRLVRDVAELRFALQGALVEVAA